MAVGILTIRGDNAHLEFKTKTGTHFGVPFHKPEWATLTDKYAVLLSVREENDCVSHIHILTYFEVY